MQVTFIRTPFHADRFEATQDAQRTLNALDFPTTARLNEIDRVTTHLALAGVEAEFLDFVGETTLLVH